MRILGLDIGIGSVGWGVIDVDGHDPETGEVSEHETVVACGARCFEVPEEPDSKELKNKGRRQARGQRRVIRRRGQRLREVRRLLLTAGLPEPLPLPKGTATNDTWRLRAEGLDRRLAPAEWARVLVHLARHRGFKSNSKRQQADNKSDDGKMLQAVMRTDQLGAGWRTAGETVALDPAFALRKRNTCGDYSHTLLRARIEEEARKLFAAQRELGNPHADAALAARYVAAAFFQRPLASSLELVGACRFEPAEKRASRYAPSFERFRFLQRVNNLKVVEARAAPRAMSDDERCSVLALWATIQQVKFSNLRKAMRLAEAVRFDGLAYGGKTNPEGATFADFTGTCRLREALGEKRFPNLLATRPEVPDAAAAAILFNEDDAQAEAALRGTGLTEDEVAALVAALGRFAGLRGTGHVSALACRRLLPHLEAGHVYSEACRLAGYDHAALGVVDLDRLPNPVVRKVIGECLKQIRVVFREYGVPDRVHLEMARDLGKSRDDRLQLYKGNTDRTADRERHREEYTAAHGGSRPNDEELLRYELWKEQDHRCLYTGQYISPAQLVAADNSVQVDHILPYSRSQDDSFRNKALVTAKANQDKRDRTLWEWFGEGDPGRWEELEARLGLLHGLHKEKKRKLLHKSFAEREEAYKARHLQDTRYAMRALGLLLAARWPELATRKDEQRRILTRPGAITALVRRGLGLDEAKRSGALGDRDHALDALVVAWTSDAVLKRLTDKAKEMEIKARARLVPELVADPGQKERIRSTFLAAAEKVFVSRPESRRGRGPAHKDTLYAFEPAGDGAVTRFQKVPVVRLEAKHLDRVKNPERSRALVEAARAWLEAAERAGHKPGKLERWAKASPLRMPARGGEGPIVRTLTLRLPERVKGGMPLKRGDAVAHVDIDTMVRVDVFTKGGKFYLVPVYTWQVGDRSRWPQPPMRAIRAAAAEAEWYPIDGTFEFRFSLYSGAFVEASRLDKTGNLLERHQGYFRAVDRTNGRISYSKQNDYDSKAQLRFTTMTLSSLKKYHVDRLGRIHEIEKEPRLWHGGVCS